MQVTSPASFRSYFRARSPFRRSLEGWVLATMSATVVLFLVVDLVFLLSFTAPPLKSQVAVLLLSLVAGAVLTVFGALLFWVVVVPAYWMVWRCAWGLRSAISRRGAAAS